MSSTDEVIVDIQALGEARDERHETHLILTAILESGQTAEIIFTEEAAARAFVLLDKARKNRGWKLRDVPIDKIDIH